MEAQQFDHWIPQNQYIPTTGIFDFPSDISSVRSTSDSPTSSQFDTMAVSIYQNTYPHPTAEDFSPFAYPVHGLPRSEMGSPDDTPYCSPRQGTCEPAHSSYPHTAQERSHTTSGRRRAQNRAAQRAFRERKEKHARDLEAQLSALTARYKALETSHAELSASYDKLRKTIELLTRDDDDGGSNSSSSSNNGSPNSSSSSSSSTTTSKTSSSSSLSSSNGGVEVLRKVLGILHSEIMSGAKSREGSADSGVKLEE